MRAALPLPLLIAAGVGVTGCPQAPPIEQVADVYVGLPLVLQGDYFYFGCGSATGLSSVCRVSKFGGSSELLSYADVLPDNLNAMTADGDAVYWGTTTGVIRRLALSGGEAVTLTTTSNCVVGIAVHDGQLAWSERSTCYGIGAVRRMPAGGGAVETLDVQVEPVGIAADDSGLYWLDNRTWVLKRLPPGASTAVPLSLGIPAGMRPDVVELHGDHVYGLATGCVWRMPKTGGAPSHCFWSLEPGADLAGALVLDSRYAFAGPMRMPIEGGPGETFVTFGRPVAVDDDYIYYAGERLVRRAKEGAPSALPDHDCEAPPLLGVCP